MVASFTYAEYAGPLFTPDLEPIVRYEVTVTDTEDGRISEISKVDDQVSPWLAKPLAGCVPRFNTGD